MEVINRLFGCNSALLTADQYKECVGRIPDINMIIGLVLIVLAFAGLLVAIMTLRMMLRLSRTEREAQTKHMRVNIGLDLLERANRALNESIEFWTSDAPKQDTLFGSWESKRGHEYNAVGRFLESMDNSLASQDKAKNVMMAWNGFIEAATAGGASQVARAKAPYKSRDNIVREIERKVEKLNAAIQSWIHD